MGERLFRPGRWHLAAALVVVAGFLAAAFGAKLVADRDTESGRDAFRSSSQQIAAALKLVIQRDEDLTISTSALVAHTPELSQRELRRWFAHMRAFERYPELSGFGLISVVPAGELDAFARRMRADPPGPLGPGSYKTLASGRPFHCLVTASAIRAGSPRPPADTDWCSPKTAGSDAVLRSRDAGEGAYAPIDLRGSTVLGMQTPQYRGGTVPATVAGRRKSFIGATGMVLAPKLMLERALSGHPNTALSIRFRNGVSDVTFSSGRRPADATSTTLPISRGWTMRISGPRVPSGVLAQRSSMLVLAGGAALSVLLGLLLFTLGTGRSRALRLVREKTSELTHLALHDALTDLPNRALVLDRVEQMLARAARDQGDIAALFVDIDGFKQVNDTLGHAAGDQVLITVAERLRSVVRDADTVGRLGGDEFVVLVESTTARPDLVAKRIIDVMRQPIELGEGKTASVSASIGIAVGRRESADDLLRDADMALYVAKERGKDRLVVFDSSMQSDAEDRLELKAALRDAIEYEQFFLLYQPTFDLREQRVIGVEALIRWNHPTRGLIEPDAFIPLAEETGQIVAIGRWVLRRACEQAASWHAAGHPIGMSVNISAVQLNDDELIREVTHCLRETGLDPARLTLEITETALMEDVNVSSQHLRALKELGVRLAIDDFGTGYSSLGHLRQLPVDALKIDRSFISGNAGSGESRAIIHTLVQLGKALDIETLAEGIEQDDQLELLRNEDVDHGQGFLLARPLTVEATEHILNQSNWTAGTRA